MQLSKKELEVLKASLQKEYYCKGMLAQKFGTQLGLEHEQKMQLISCSNPAEMLETEQKMTPADIGGEKE